MPVYMLLIFSLVAGLVSYGVSAYALSRLATLFDRLETLFDIGSGTLSERLSFELYLISAGLLFLYFIVGKALPLKWMRPLGWLSALWMAYLTLVLFYAGSIHLIEWSVLAIFDLESEHIGMTLLTTLSLVSVHVGLVWGVYNASRSPRLKKVKICHSMVGATLDGFKVLQLSDVHIGPTVGGRFIKRLTSLIERAKPDLIVMTGDLVDGEVKLLGPEVEDFLALSQLAPQGMLLITGNHEYISGAEPWVSFIKSKGGRVLENEHVMIERENAKLAVIGIEDWDAARFDPRRRPLLSEAMTDIPDDAFKLLLAHQPKAATEAAEAGVHLQLSGHTHAGQIFPFNFLIYLDQPYNLGYYQVGEMALYVNPGTAYWGPPLRLGTRSEVTLFTLTENRPKATIA